MEDKLRPNKVEHNTQNVCVDRSKKQWTKLYQACPIQVTSEVQVCCQRGRGCRQTLGKETGKKLLKPCPGYWRSGKLPLHYRQGIEGKDLNNSYMKINVTLLFLFCCDLQGWTMKPEKGQDLTTQTCKSVAIYKSFYFFFWWL